MTVRSASFTSAGTISRSRPFDVFRRAWQDLATRPKGNIAGLDVLRSLAILLVFSGHFAEEFKAKPGLLKFPLFYWGWTGVDLFFVLSGFLIGAQLWRELQKSGNIRIGRFILRRGFRIWPLYFSFVAVIAMECLAGRSTSGLWADALCVSNYFAHQIGGGWSLSTEEQFYLAAPIAICLLARWGLKPGRDLWLLPAGWLILVAAARAFTIHQGGPDLTSRLYFPAHTHSDGLALGLLIAWMQVFRPSWMFRRSFRTTVLPGAAAFAIALYFADRQLWNFTSLAILCGIAASLAVGARSTPRLLRWNGFYVVSRLSFGVYLNHFGLLPLLKGDLGTAFTTGQGIAFWSGYVIALAASIAIAFLTFALIELPFLRLRAKQLSVHPQDLLPRMPALQEKAA